MLKYSMRSISSPFLTPYDFIWIGSQHGIKAQVRLPVNPNILTIQHGLEGINCPKDGRP